MGKPTARLAAAAAMLLLAAALPLAAQRDTTGRVDKTFFTRKDLVVLGIGFGASVVFSAFDERIASWTQDPSVQGGDSRRNTFELVTNVNEVPLTLGAAATYAIARLAGWETIADAGLHTTEALVLTVLGAEAIRAPLGRARPRASPGDAFEFKAGAGFTEFDHRSYPSIHSAAAFATAAAVVGEVRVHSPKAVKVVAPIVYTAALVPGITRMYLNQHWTSDVVSGAVLGFWFGYKTVRYAHTHERNRLDRMLLGMTVVPSFNGGVAVALSRRL